MTIGSSTMTIGTKHPSLVKISNPPELFSPTAFGYSHICEVENFTKIIHIAGQGGENINGELSSIFEAQLDQVFANIKATLDFTHLDFQNIAMLRVLIVDFDEQKHQKLISKMNTIWHDQKFPACTLIPVPRLALAAMQIEIEATAYFSY